MHCIVKEVASFWALALQSNDDTKQSYTGILASKHLPCYILQIMILVSIAFLKGLLSN